MMAPADPSDRQMFVTSPGDTCTYWVDRESQFTSATIDWAGLDTGVLGSHWTPAQRSLQLSAVSHLAEWADDMEAAGEQSNNPVFDDFAALAALNIRAYVPLGDKYIDTDAWLTYTAFRLSNVISGACRAAG
ncbi:hypothetical protein ASD37_13350 [Mycobacterium sp. Root135]|nr:hypothetical protein ASD37_13350 [Mycobacterium sp. Root135]